MALDAVPEGASYSIRTPAALSKWQSNGYFTVTKATKSGFDVVVGIQDIGGALLTDADYLLDAATEHQATLWRQINTAEWTSPGWVIVTFYYWSFFMVLALTRILGRTSWYIAREPAQNLVRLAPVTVQSPGAGCYRLALGQPLSVTDRELQLRRSANRIHDDIWRVFDDLCRTHLQPAANRAANDLEDRLYTTLVLIGNKLGPEWPSSFRNLVNYRQEFGYAAGRQGSRLPSYSYLRSPTSYQFPDLLQRFEARAVSLRHGDVVNRPADTALLLVDFCLILHALVFQIHADVIERRGLDQRWRKARDRFVRSAGLMSPNGAWPC